MQHIETSHVFEGKAIEHITRPPADPALVRTEEHALARLHRHARRAVLAKLLPAAHELHAFIDKAPDHVLGSFVSAEDAHVRGARRPETPPVHRYVHGVAAGIHDAQVLVAVDDVIPKAQDRDVESHGCPP